MNFPARYKADIVSAVESIDLEKVVEVIDLFKHARARRRNIFVCGGTRSASTASKVLCDMIACSSFERPVRFRIFALDDRAWKWDADGDTASSEKLFVEQVKNFAEPGDVVVGISASDKSASILRTFEYAACLGCKIVALTGLDGGKLAALANVAIPVGSTNFGTVEDTHVIICHMIGSYFLEFEGRSRGTGPAEATSIDEAHWQPARRA
ncbi:MAG TPA: SIS domain-containing protein [Bryobacteraceae bacterium]|jgi:D-sedoheptulose 7-phosphate isomerase